ncbi:MAG TPA: M3 family metallopeptidase [Polyangiaceae bacterium]|nr:M3 family metallopeptidase [Polyangiaceae bacterium]
MENPLVSPGRPLPFDGIDAAHVVPGLRALLTEADRRLNAIDAARPSYEASLAVLDAATEQLELAMGIVEHLESVATTSELREAHNTILPEVSAFSTSLPLRENVWQALLAFSETDEARSLAPTERRLLDKTLADFRRHGATLDADGKRRLAELDRELGLITNKFSQNVLDATNAFEVLLSDQSRLGGLPASAIDAARASAEAKGKAGYRLTLQAPSVISVLTYADDRSLREQIWRAQNARALGGDFDNRPLIAEILRLRAEKAKLLGFSNFADLVTEDRMAKSGGHARTFVDELTRKTQTAFERENQELYAFRQKLEGPAAPPLAPWDLGYYAEKLRRERYALDEEELRQYFPADRVLAGAFLVAERLFGVRVEQVSGLPTWDSEVTAYSLSDSTGARLGTFYVDLYPRENKRGGAWMHGLWAGTASDPHVAVFCANVSPPVGNKPSLLTHRDVETLFHEFGHLLHHCLSRVSVRSLACTRVAQDFVELPSQIMENWCSERDALNLFARHYESGAPIPEHLLEQLRAARTFRAANAQMRQLGFAAVDLALHIDYDPARDGDVMRYARALSSRYSAAELPEDYGMLASFLHLFSSPVGYAAGYYSYKWAEVLDADAFSRFRSEGVLNSQVGAEFRDRVLALGDSRDPMDLFKSFMGREPRPEALLERQGLAA